MPKCNKIKNPCKICLGNVNAKIGIQCQGACQTWVHFDCLNYTPGKIKDIKAGVIKVSCPCPDCKTTLPKEYRTDEPYSCSNMQCPANRPPKCENLTCPINNGTDPLPVATGCALDQCGKSCKPNSYPQVQDSPQTPQRPACKPAKYQLPVAPSESSEARLDYNAYPSGCVPSRDIPGDFGRDVSPDTSLGTLEQMCNTVGQLTNEINDLMSKMRRVVDEKNGCGRKGCTQKGPKSTCPKPCFCPGNPGRRK